VVFEIGANIGEWSQSLLETALQFGLEQIQVQAFEPTLATFQTLQTNLARHPLGRQVHCTPMALSNQVGTTELFVVGENAGTNSLHQDSLAKNSVKVQIATTTLDLFCQQNGIEQIHLVKCDTEGHDLYVLYGARGLIANERILVFQFEYNHRWVYSRHYLKDIFDFIKDTSYCIGKITPHGINLYSEWHPELDRFFEANYVIIHNSVLKWFNVHHGTFDAHNTYA
jgi:FkbM family methyltransferase